MASRTCTILFTDLVGSTELRGQLGDDAFDARRREHDRLLAEAIARNEGELVKNEGDGVMAVFSSAADALTCAVIAQQGIARESGRHDAPLLVRVGVSAGDVAEEDGDYHGTPVVEAARLCNVARGGQIVAADVVRVLAGSRGSHEFLPLGNLELKGLPDAVNAWEVGWSSADGALDMPLRLGEVAARGACVGRDGELQEVIAAWKQAAMGERRLVLVAGEPGIGKTRLAAELASRVIAHGGIALHGWCDEDLGSPYQPWAQSLGAYARATSPEALAGDAGSGLADLGRLLPEVVALSPDTLRAPASDAETERARLFDAVDMLVAEISNRQPMLFVLDDVHWADRPSLGLLRRLLQSDRPGSVLFLATYRDTDVDRRHPLAEVLADLRREPRVSRVALGGLDEAGLGALLADRAGHDPPEAFVRILLDETEGNPFFVEEVIAHLAETGTIYQREGVWVSDLAPDDLGLPEGVRDVVGRRLSRLPESANELLTVAAVVGREFDLGIVVTAGGFERDGALDALDSALGTGLVVEVPHTTGRYSFSHALVRQTLTEEISGARRARLHWKIGDALASRRDSPLSSIAFHLCEGVLAGDVTRAAESAVLAAEHARDLAAPEESRLLAQRALDVLSDADADEPLLRCRALLVLGEGSAVVAQNLVVAREQLVEAAALARAHGWSEYAGRASLAYGWLFTPGESDPRASELAMSALELGAIPEWRPALLTTVGGNQISDGNFAEGIAYLDEAWAAAANPAAAPGARFSAGLGRASFLQAMPDPEGHAEAVRLIEAAATEVGSSSFMAMAELFHGTVALRRGDRAEFERRVESVRARFANNSTQPDVLMTQASLALLDGRFDDSDRLAIEMFGVVDPASASFVNASAQLAAGLYWRGRDEELIGAIRAFPSEQWPQAYLLDLVCASTRARRGERDPELDALAANNFARIPVGYHRTGSLCHAGSAVAWLGEKALAPPLIEMLEPYEGLLLCAPLGCLVFDAADSVRGLLLLTLDRVEEAIGCFEGALSLCEQLRDVPHATMARQRLARALLTRGNPEDRERARSLASDALEHATELGLAPDVRFAQAILDEL